MKKKLTIILAIAMMATMMTACGGNDTTTDDTSSADVVTEEVTEAEDADADADTEAEEEEDADADADAEEEEETQAVIVLPDGVAAEDGDAYLAYGDAEWWLQYGGNDMDNLAFGAEVVHIDGDGTYTVSLDASDPDAVGMNGLDTITGCSFCAIVIKNGEELFPDQATSITIDSITLDGNEVEFTKNYCNYEDGNLRTNIFNSYVSQAPTEDVWTADGDLDGISAQIVPASTFDTPFSKIEVTFTISSTGDTAAAEDDADADSDEELVEDDNASEGDEADVEVEEDAEAEDAE